MKPAAKTKGRKYRILTKKEAETPQEGDQFLSKIDGKTWIEIPMELKHLEWSKHSCRRPLPQSVRRKGGK